MIVDKRVTLPIESLKYVLIVFVKFIFQCTPEFIIKIYLVNNHSMRNPSNKSPTDSHLLHALSVTLVGLFQLSLSITKLQLF